MLSKSILHWAPARTAQARKTQFGGLSEARLLKVLTDENAKLKKMLADADPYRKLSGLPANHSLLNAQASMQDDSFEARWRARFLDAMEK